MADIYTITVPDLVIEITDDQKMDFAGFIRWTVATHTKYNSDAAGIRSAARLERKFEHNRPTSFDIDAEDWNRLVVAAENPLGGYPIRPAYKLLPFVEAIVTAKRKE